MRPARKKEEAKKKNKAEEGSEESRLGIKGTTVVIKVVIKVGVKLAVLKIRGRSSARGRNEHQQVHLHAPGCRQSPKRTITVLVAAAGLPALRGRTQPGADPNINK